MPSLFKILVWGMTEIEEVYNTERHLLTLLAPGPVTNSS
jgi:hypothetical protein